MAAAEGGGLGVGMPVRAADGRSLGVVEAVGGGTRRVAGAAHPPPAVARIDGGIVVLAPPGGATARAAPDADERHLVPLAEERLTVGTRPIALGEVELRRRVVAEERQVPVVAWREELVVQRRAPGRPW